jgi:excisionase family DNA binding protein
MPNKTFFTVAEAARQVGVSRQTVFDKIKAGKLSATVNGEGVKVVDVSELLRVFGRLLSPDEVKQKELGKARQAPGQADLGALQLELERAKMQLELREKDFELEHLRRSLEESKERERKALEEKERFITLFERQTLLLAAPKPASRAKPAAKAAPAPAPVVKKPAAKPLAKVVAKPATAAKAKPAAAAKKVVAKAPTRPTKKATRK